MFFYPSKSLLNLRLGAEIGLVCYDIILAWFFLRPHTYVLG